jgi:sulfide:quinone oxidoreductase
MAKIVIIGASIGGLSSAYQLKDVLGHSHEVTVISNTENFNFVPSNPWVGVGWRKRKDVCFSLKPCLAGKNINFVASAAKNINPQKQEVTTSEGATLPFDYLVIATGASLAFNEIEGLGPEQNTVSVCTIDHAEKAYDDYKKLLENPGPVIIGAAQGASCFGPAYEFAFILDADLRKKGLRRKIPMSFITSEPYIGHMGLSGVGDSKSLLEHEFRQRHISWHTNTRIKKAAPGKMTIETMEEGALELPFNYSMIMPSFKGVDVVAELKEMCNPKGFVVVDEFQRSKAHKNIYAVGVCVAIAPPEPTPVPTGTPKTGYMIESMVSAAVHNIKAAINGESPTAKATLNAICLADMGDTGVAFVALPQVPPRNVTWAKKGKWVHLAKAGFEKYFIRKMKKGVSEPFYEKIIFDALGIKKLE